MNAVIAEVYASCPEVYSLVQELGNTQTNARDSVLPFEELQGWGDGNLYFSQYMVYKGKGGVANDESDAGCKGNRQIRTCMFY